MRRLAMFSAGSRSDRSFSQSPGERAEVLKALVSVLHQVHMARAYKPHLELGNTAKKEA
jgi:hypothetical protein